MIKFCLDSRVSSKYRKKAQELYIEYRDFKSIPNYLEEDYENITLIIDAPVQLTVEQLGELKRYTRHKENIILALHSYNQLTEDYEGLKWYLMVPCNSFMEAKALQDAGAEYIVLGETLFFDITRLKDYGIKNVRIMVNQASHSPVPRKNGICGPWIRPEDLAMYDIFDQTIIEFPGCMPSKEEALYRIYAEEHRWAGELDYIIDNINVKTPNRMLPSEFTTHRLNCRQRCNTCHICPNLIRLANNILDNNEIKLF